MSIANAIQNAQQKVAAAYTACDGKGATMPAAGSQNLANLPVTIESISAGGGPGDYDVEYYTSVTTADVVNENTGDTETSTIIQKNILSLSSGTTTMPATFNNDTSLVGVNLPSTMRTLSQNSFHGCSNLFFVGGLDNIEYVGRGAFQNCTNLRVSIYLPNYKGMTSSWSGVDNTTFTGSNIARVRSLGSVTIVDGASSSGAFQNCKNLASVQLPSTLVRIGVKAFYGCTALTTVNLNNLPNLTTLEAEAFEGCTALTGVVNLPSLTGAINNQIFQQTKITKVENLGTCTVMYGGTSSGAFNNCTSLTSVTLPETLTNVGIRGFYYCTALTSCNFPAALVKIQQSAFYYTKIQSVDLSGSSEMTLENDCFRQTTALTTVKLPTNTVLSGGFQFADQGGNSYNATTAASLDFDIDLSDSETTTLSACAFYRSKLTRFVAPSGLTTIAAASSNRGVFEGSSYLLEVDLPSTLTSIGNRAFRDCTHLTTLTCRATTPPTFGSQALYNNGALANIYVPADSVDAYKAASGWSGFAAKISAITE